MKYRILLAGKNQTTIDDFFYVMNDTFECMTTSVRSFDIANHVKYFKPDAVVYCMTVETKESVMTLVNALNEVSRKKQRLILIGEPEACTEFMKWKPEMVSLVLEKPLNANAVTERIVKLLKEEQETISLSDEELNAAHVAVKEQEEEKQLQKKPVAAGNGNKQILIIDDDPMMLKLIKEELREDYNVATAISGKIGLNFLERKHTDLILLDYEMPGESGPEVLEKLRANVATKDIPVVFLTGINDREKIQKVLAMKPQGYLLKPIDHDKLVQTINNVIG